MQSDPIGLEGGLNAYIYANSNPLSFIDASGTTACDVNAAFSAIKETFPQLSTDAKWIWWDFDWGGVVNSPTEATTGILWPLIRIETEYRPCLNWGQALSVLQIVMHELLHYNDTIKGRYADWRNPNHTDHYIEASKMARRAIEAYRRIRNSNCCSESACDEEKCCK